MLLVFRSCTDDPTCKCAFQWPDNSTVVYTNWLSGHPQFESPCTRMSNGGQWSITNCNTQLLIPICESKIRADYVNKHLLIMFIFSHWTTGRFSAAAEPPSFASAEPAPLSASPPGRNPLASAVPSSESFSAPIATSFSSSIATSFSASQPATISSSRFYLPGWF
jgi:hypothetical protein